jgi:hypothetical protein
MDPYIWWFKKRLYKVINFGGAAWPTLETTLSSIRWPFCPTLAYIT